jgi:hypothetical protein
MDDAPTAHLALAICHTFLSFDFGPDGFVCISIETRMTKSQVYSPIAVSLGRGNT